MKKITCAMIASLILIPVISFAQSSQTPAQPPASWVAFMKQENVKRSAFFQQMKADRDAFLSANPDVKAYLDQMRANAQTRMAAWRAAHPPRHAATPTP